MNIKEIFNFNIKETISNKERLIYLIIGIIISYYLFNLISSILKYPIIIIFGFLLGNFIKNNEYIQNTFFN